jgi:hypothetical protein
MLDVHDHMNGKNTNFLMFKIVQNRQSKMRVKEPYQNYICRK